MNNRNKINITNSNYTKNLNFRISKTNIKV